MLFITQIFTFACTNNTCMFINHFHCWMLNDNFDCDDLGTVISHNVINVLFHWVKFQFLFHMESQYFRGIYIINSNNTISFQNIFFNFSVILGNAYLSLFFAAGQNPKSLKQSMSAYSQAVSVISIYISILSIKILPILCF